MGTVGMETGFEWTGIIIFISFLLGVWQLLVHIGRYCIHRLSGKSTEQHDQEQQSQGNGTEPREDTEFSMPVFLAPYVEPFFAYALATIYFLAIVGSVFSSYRVFNNRGYQINVYLEIMADMCLLQTFVLIIAWLLRVYSEQAMHRLLPWGFFIMGLDVVFETALQFYRYPIYHWVQFLDIFLMGIGLLLIPLTGFILFRYLNRRAKTLPQQL